MKSDITELKKKTLTVIRIKLNKLISKTAERALSLQNKDGSMPPGNNGPYDDQETPVRNTSHWLITFVTAYEETGNPEFKEAANQAIDYLRSESARPHGKTFFHRENSDKDSCNGLIGQAWTIEALSIAGDKLERPELLELAEEIFLLHPFNEDFGVWKIVDINGDLKGYDPTFNHQLWFAAAGSTLESEEVNKQIQVFADNLEYNLTLYNDGLIFHPLTRISPSKDLNKCFKNSPNGEFLAQMYRKRVRRVLGISRSKKQFRSKCIGYHSFNLYALAILKKNIPKHKFWDTNNFRRAFQFILKKKYVES